MSTACPLPISHYPQVLMAHGGGGRLMMQLIDELFVAALAEQGLQATTDAAAVALPGRRLAFTTDSFVVKPRFFPGGDIGSLSVYGTVNDLAVCGAEPRYLSLGMILEEGLPMAELWRLAQSIAAAARQCGVEIVTGDTKVVERGHGDGLYINTSGIGDLADDLDLGPHRIEPGDAIVVNGDLGRHAIAVISCRDELAFETTVESDAAPLIDDIRSLLSAGIEVHCMRDLTRGGLASCLNELAAGRDFGLRLLADRIPVREDVSGACEMLGFDPLYLANEGRFVAIVAPADLERALALLRQSRVCPHPAHIGEVTPTPRGKVVEVSRIGADRLVDLLSGEQLPRIC